MKQRLELESTLERNACNWVKDTYGDVPLKFTPRGSNGWPDRVFILPNAQVIWWEAKRHNKEPSSLQRQRLITLCEYGHNVVPYDVDLTEFKTHYEKIRSLAVPETRHKENNQQRRRSRIR